MTRELSPSDRAKFVASRHALSLVEAGMRIGLGTGSTAAWFLRLLADRIRQEKLDIVGVPTSLQTGEMAERLGIPLTTLDEAGWLDLAVDGADEIGPNLTLIKGGGGALLQEKIVATASDRMVVIADETKLTASLGAFPLPVEIVPFGWETTKAIVEETLEGCDVGGRKATLRLNRDEPFVTDEGHFIIDLHLMHIARPQELALQLNQIPGVVETGLFIEIADLAVIGYATGEVKVIDLDEGETVFAPRSREEEESLFRRLEH
ncbi:MAG TPA: ribose-5-phosphate isomerase RpiA [Paracoccaceae bacterium]|nr:ribose-5-phosphate isomerase RpiA [Paracoccaceae bacterium]